MHQFNPLVLSHPSLVELDQDICVLHSDEPVSMETNPQEPTCSIQHTLSIAQHLSGALCLLWAPCAHYPNADRQQNDRRSVLSSVFTQFFLVWMRSQVQERRTDISKSVPFMFYYSAYGGENRENKGLQPFMLYWGMTENVDGKRTTANDNFS